MSRLFVLGWLWLFVRTARCEPQVTLSSGTYVGETVTSQVNGATYSVFKGIKFANLVQRFKEAEPVGDSEETFEATQFGPACFQEPNYAIPPVRLNVSEDCFYVNVYTPDLKGNLPVLVFIYGGAYVGGATSLYGGEFFMESMRVVAVTIPYRVSVFGFMYFDDDRFPANLGIRDQILGLKWVQNNIKKFGGDPNRVTINGQSAGAFSVSILTNSPLAKGLFVGAIQESGTACALGALQPRCTGLNRRNALALVSGCRWHIPFKQNSSASLVKCLQSKSAYQLFKDVKTLQSLHFQLEPFLPIVERKSTVNAVITEFPSLAGKDSLDLVPILTGVNSNEGKPFYPSLNYLEKLGLEIFVGLTLPNLLLYRFTAPNTLFSTAAIKFHYFPRYLTNFKQFFIELVSNTGFFYPMTRCLRNIKSPTYAYYFNYTENPDDKSGAGHADELLYTWMPDFCPQRNNPASRKLSKAMVDAWTDFAYYQEANFSGVVWERYDSEKDNVLVIDNTGYRMATNPNKRNDSFYLGLKLDQSPKTSSCFLY